MKVPRSVAEQHTERAVIRIRNKNVEVAVMIDIRDSNRCRPFPHSQNKFLGHIGHRKRVFTQVR
jgi:hypothetical protein